VPDDVLTPRQRNGPTAVAVDPSRRGEG